MHLCHLPEMVKLAKRDVLRKDAVSVRADSNVELAGPFRLDVEVARQGKLHIERLLELNRQRMASWDADCFGGEKLQLGITGAGVMGAAIAADALEHGMNVLLMDADEAALHRGAERVMKQVGKSGTPSSRFGVTQDLDEIASCEMVLEAVVEDEMKKAALLRDLDKRMPAEKLLATNTSTIPIGRLARALQNPDRLCGTHFFLPLPERPMVEVIFSSDTSTEIRAAAIRFAARLDRSVVLAPDAVGFVVNRLMMPYVSEAMQLLTEGVQFDVVEQVAVQFGMPKGPLSLLDEIGLDTALDCGWVFAGAYEERIAVSPLLVAMVKAGRLGQKTGAGFFRYSTAEDGSSRQVADPAAAELVARWATPANTVTEEEVASRLFLPMVFEGTRILDEHDRCVPADVDLGVVLGLGMAPQRGGPLFWCDQVGTQALLDIAAPFKGLGPRMEPPVPLQRMAEEETCFYDPNCMA